MTLMKCNNCGSSITKNQKFCGKCGHIVNGKGAHVENKKPDKNDSQEKNNTLKIKIKKILDDYIY